MAGQTGKALLIVLCFASLGCGGGICFLMVTMLSMNVVAPGQILKVAFTFIILAVGQILWAVFGIIAFKKDKHELVIMYYMGLYLLILFEVVLGVIPIVVFTWSFIDLKEQFTQLDRSTYLHIEQYYGCCGVKNATDYYLYLHCRIPASCCGDNVCDLRTTKLYEHKKGCLEAVKPMAVLYLFTGVLNYASVAIHIFSIVKTYKYIKANLP